MSKYFNFVKIAKFLAKLWLGGATSLF